MATDAQIKAAYRRTALEHHPDKHTAAADGDSKQIQAAEERFKAIQEAYETLSDPSKRKEFDSLDPFDDSLPGEDEASDAASFYRHFGAAFKRNSKWSVHRPVPDLGDDKLDDASVDAFYDFWFGFKSWREFPHPDEEDVEAAESREEKRWIERYNAKLREKAKKEEVRRLKEFVSLAHKYDPRMIRRKEEERLEKERKKAEKEAARLKKIEEERKAAEAQAQIKRQEEEDRLAAKKQRQIEKKALQKERSKLRKLTGVSSSEELPCQIEFSEESIELICQYLNLEDIKSLNDFIASDISLQEKKCELERCLAAVSSCKENEKAEKVAAAKAAAHASIKEEKEQLAERIAKLKTWDKEEVRLLRKALDKFPPGTSKRWDTIQGYLRTRTVDEILDMVKYGLKSGKIVVEESGQDMSMKKKPEIQSAATQRHESFTDVEVKPAQTTDSSGDTHGNNDQWTAAEELSLVKALKEIPKTVEDRWDQVALAVKTKSKVQCALRFKELKKNMKAKK